MPKQEDVIVKPPPDIHGTAGGWLKQWNDKGGGWPSNIMKLKESGKMKSYMDLVKQVKSASGNHPEAEKEKKPEPKAEPKAESAAAKPAAPAPKAPAAPVQENPWQQGVGPTPAAPPVPPAAPSMLGGLGSKAQGLGAKLHAGAGSLGGSIGKMIPSLSGMGNHALGYGAGALGAGAAGAGIAGLYNLLKGSPETERMASLMDRTKAIHFSAADAGFDYESLNQKFAKKAQDERIGTPFTDGFLYYCMKNEFNGTQVADLLEKGAELLDGKAKTECAGFIERSIK